jgi:hypothetical protein
MKNVRRAGEVPGVSDPLRGLELVFSFCAAAAAFACAGIGTLATVDALGVGGEPWWHALVWIPATFAAGFMGVALLALWWSVKEGT